MAMLWDSFGLWTLTIPVATVGLFPVIFSWRKVEEGNYQAFLCLGQLAYEMIVSKKYDLIAGQDGVGQAVPTKGGGKDVGGRLGLFRFGGLVFFVRKIFAPDGDPVPLGVGQGKITLDKAETTEPVVKPATEGSSVAVGIDFVYDRRPKVPYRMKHNVEGSLATNLHGKLEPVAKGITAACSGAELKAMKGNGAAIEAKIISLGMKPIFTKIETDWGVEVPTDGFGIGDVRFPPGYQDTLQAEDQATRQAKADRVKSKALADMAKEIADATKATGEAALNAVLITQGLDPCGTVINAGDKVTTLVVGPLVGGSGRNP